MARKNQRRNRLEKRMRLVLDDLRADYYYSPRVSSWGWGDRSQRGSGGEKELLKEIKDLESRLFLKR